MPPTRPRRRRPSTPPTRSPASLRPTGSTTCPPTGAGASCPALWYLLTFAAFQVFPVGMLVFVERVIDPGPFRIVRRLWQAHIAVGILVFALDLANRVPLPQSLDWLTPLYVVDTLVCVALCARAMGASVEARWIGAGIIAFSAGG